MKSNKENNQQTIEIFWTGGFDSTFRVLQLSRMPVHIKPYYLSDNRKSEQQELTAIKEITHLLRSKKETKAQLLPLEVVDKSQRIKDASISAAYQKISATTHIGSQYEWLSWFAKNHKGIELSIELGEYSTMQKIIKGYKKVSDSTIGDYYTMDKNSTSKDGYALFGNFHFPIIGLKKSEMKNYFLQTGCKDILDLTWFCFTPIMGKPCGFCTPCHQKIEDGMTDRFTKRALLMHKLLFPIKKIVRPLKAKLMPA